jgi:hypothetical protein
MRIRGWGALLLVAALLGAVRGAAESAASAIASTVAPAASLPPALLALEAKMARLTVTSERFSQTVHATATRHIGGHHRHVKRVSVNETELGEVSLSPLEGKLFRNGDPGKPIAIAIGLTLYSYSPTIASKDRGRPWIEMKGVSAAELFPNHGGSNEEINAGGTGSYAGLINLLTTAVAGTVSVVGPVQVDGQQTTEVSAVVDPLALVSGTSKKEIQAHPLLLRLTAFVTESGLPLRVGFFFHLGPVAVAETSDILAVNIPVSVTAPPANLTIDEAEFLKLLRGKRTPGGTGFSLEPPG